MRLLNLGKTHALLALATAFLSACGSDSTAPATLDANGALQSLAIGLNQTGGVTATTDEADATLGVIAPVLGQVTVNIDGAAQTMYALGLRESYPPGTCEETLFVTSSPTTCTPITQTVLVILWQTHSATQPPDKMALLISDPGTSDFDFAAAGNDFPAEALYFEGPTSVWSSESGTLTTQVTSNNQSCNIVLPPYAKSATCNIATFAETGSIVFSSFTQTSGINQTLTIDIPSVTLRGIWLDITTVQPAPLGPTPSRLLPLGPARLRVAQGRYQIPGQR